MPSSSSLSSFDEAAVAGTGRLGNGSTRHDPGPGITAPIPMSAYEPMQKQVEAWQRSELTDVTAKVVIYEAFVEGRLEAPKHFARSVHDLYFEPKYEEFRPRTIWTSRMRLPRRSRNWIPSRSLKPRPSWANSSRPASRSRFSGVRYRPGRSS